MDVVVAKSGRVHPANLGCFARCGEFSAYGAGGQADIHRLSHFCSFASFAVLNDVVWSGEDPNQTEDLYVKAGLLAAFSDAAFCDRLALFEATSRNSP